MTQASSLSKKKNHRKPCIKKEKKDRRESRHRDICVGYPCEEFHKREHKPGDRCKHRRKDEIPGEQGTGTLRIPRAV